MMKPFHGTILLLLALMLFSAGAMAQGVQAPIVGGDTGYYAISSSPSGAVVTFDGIPEGTTPVTVSVSTTGTPGHTIVFTMAGYQTATKTLNGNPAAGETIYVTETLQPIFVTPTLTIWPTPTQTPIGGGKGYYYFTSSPSGAYVTFDGSNEGTTPVSVEVSSTGTPGHTVSMDMGGYQPWSKYLSGNPQEGQTVYVNADLVPIVVTTPPTIGGDKGYYAISSSPSGAYVTFDGKNQGTTPVTVEVSTTGTPGHTIVVSMANYQTWTQTYPGNPSAGQTIQVNAVLSPVTQYGTINVGTSPQGAYAYLDNGVDSLTTPGTFYNVMPGWHNVRISKSGYQTYTQDVQVTAGGAASVFTNLNPITQAGTISVTSNPSGADVYVDTIYQGDTPKNVGGLSPGVHTVKLMKSGYQTWSNSYTVYSNQITYVNANMVPYYTPQTGDLEVSSAPAGAAVYVDNQYKGTTSQGNTLDIIDLSVGSHTVRLTKAGYQDFTSSTVIQNGQTTSLYATLVPAGQAPTKASIQVNSDPSGADVTINNVYVGITPLTQQNAQTGTSTVSISLAGYQPYTTSVQVAAGQSVQVNAALTPSATPTPTPLSPAIAVISLGIAGIAFAGYSGRKKN